MTNKVCDAAIKTVFEMIERNFGKQYCNWFSLHITEGSDDCDFFRISAEDEKVSINANNGVSLAHGVYYYLKKFCRVHLSQCGSNKNMPSCVILPQKEVYKSTLHKLRYAYNYCTHSYTMSFWGEKEWQKELDFLAFSGINLILDITGEEKVWFEFFKRIGYSEERARELLVGPAYWAWFCMANMYSYGGRLPDEYLERRVTLAKKNHEFMAKLGMKPVLMGYCGMVPEDIKSVDKSAKVIRQGKWNWFLRPAMLKTNKKTYEKYAEIFYATQKEVLGDITEYYSTDPFHEGGTKGSLSNKTVAKHILKAMKKENEQAVWVVQSWGHNPTKGLLKAVKKSKENVLVLDLYAEKEPRFKNFRGNEFQNTPWIYCMLDNFGGRMGLHGHIDNINRDVPFAMNTAKYMKGVGIAPEASNTNPLLTEFLFDSIWKEKDEKIEPANLGVWVADYLFSRYGKRSENAEKCFSILCETVFDTKYNMLGEGSAESVVNARPGFNIKCASFWGNCRIGYDKSILQKAFELLMVDYEELKSSDAYLFDVTDIKKQILANKAQDIYEEMVSEFKSKNISGFTTKSDEFLKLILEIDGVLGTRAEYSLNTWIDMAKRASEGLDEDTKKMFIQNAKKILTTWGDEVNSETGHLHDYSNRQWSGITKELYYKRWKLWVDNRTLELEGKNAGPEDFYSIEREWTMQ